jgi:hypothetical protein
MQQSSSERGKRSILPKTKESESMQLEVHLIIEENTRDPMLTDTITLSETSNHKFGQWRKEDAMFRKMPHTEISVVNKGSMT